jgi:molybdopterin-synthase adenylyltransferase
VSEDRYSRQSFLGQNSEEIFGSTTIGIVGLGGGGSHIEQQLAHVGFKKYILYDNDRAELSNLNRTVGMTVKDVALKSEKLEIAVRMIKGIHPGAEIIDIHTHWQENPIPLRECDIIFGCVDGFDERRQLEATARRYLIPYIDIGLDVHQISREVPRMAGQIILSMPGKPCLTCLGFLTEDKLAQEAAKYGAAGHRPQVIWGNGILASTAVGIAVDILTGWTKASPEAIYLLYDGNTGVVQPHPRLKFIDFSNPCIHFPLSNVGDPRLVTL